MKRLIAVCATLVVLVGAGIACVWAGDVASLPPTCLRSVYPGYDEVSNWDFMAGEYDALQRAGAAPQLIFGSSELKSAPAGPAHPGRLFADGRYGVTSVIAGRAGVNDLWQAIELGAFAQRLPQDSRRAVIFVSMQWFMCYRDPARTFPGVFSQGAYDSFMANPQISAENKQRVAQRVRAYGVNDAEAPAATPQGAVQAADRLAVDVAANLRLAQSLRAKAPAPQGQLDAQQGADSAAAQNLGANGESDARDARAGGSGAQGAGATPAQTLDWVSLIEDGRARAAKASAGNDYGFYDSWYRDSFEKWLSGAQQSWRVSDGAYFSRQEFEDFELMLDVCREAGIEPLIVIQPVKGKAYDQTIYTQEVRQAYYTTARAICDRAGVEVADFSSYEYDPLFLRDYSHPSAYGSALYAQALYDFWIR